MITWQTCDVFDGLASLEDGSIDLVVTSPPFLALRSYLPADHPDKSKEIGSEATPAEFLDVLLRVVAELRRVLAPHGSIAIELGDTYAGSQSGDSDGRLSYGAHLNGVRDSQERPKRDVSTDGWPLAKSKTLIPELFRIALAYGFNPLTGEPSPAGRWRVRNVVTWCRPNPPVGALGDKWRPATSDVVVACVSGRRFWDDLATRNIASVARNAHRPKTVSTAASRGSEAGQRQTWDAPNPSGAPLLDYWEIPPTGYAGAHYAVYPPALVEPLVKAMVPQKVCRTCGEPSRRITGNVTYGPSQSNGKPGVLAMRENKRLAPGVNQWEAKGNQSVQRYEDTLGFTDCGHNNFRPGRVLDPFAGSGTTLAVASGHGHDAIGFDLDPRNEDLARERVGPLLWQEA